MEKRTIAIANTKTQKRYQIESNATTLGELKAQLTLMGIDFAGMSFTEGLSKTQLISDDSLLPTNVSFKGQTTNNLIMLLTNTVKNIPSGASDRADAYARIKELGLQETVKETFGRNYTQVATDKLLDIIADYEQEDELDEGCVDYDDDEEYNEEYEEETPQENTEQKVLMNGIYDLIKSFAEQDMLPTKSLKSLAELITELAARIKESKVFSDEDIDSAISGIY